VDVAAVVKCLHENAAKARSLVEALARSLTSQRAPSPVDTALENAIITAPEARDPEMVRKLGQLVPRAFPPR
jgi:5'-methylthioadenosine phosphorylase